MAAPTETYVDPAVGGGNDFGGTAFTDGSFANATNTLTRTGAFPAATNIAGDKLYLTDNGSGEVTAGLYTISTRTDDNNVILSADIRSGANDPTDVVCVQHDGTISLEWATVQHALNFTTRDATNGDRINILAGTDDVLAAALSLATYGTPTNIVPLILQGYTSAAGDGGIGGISGNGTYTMFAPTSLDSINFVDLHMHNSGSAQIVHLDNSIYISHCELDNTTGGGIRLDNNGYVGHCYIHNTGGDGIRVNASSMAMSNYLENGTDDFDQAIVLDSSSSRAIFNIIDVDGASDGIVTDLSDHSVENNSIYSNGGTGQGINVIGGTAHLSSLTNNMIEGFSGVGGIGINVVTAGNIMLYGHNFTYNNATNYSISGTALKDLGNNTTLGSSPFTDPANNDFTVSTALQALGYPSAFTVEGTNTQFLDVGALQREEAGGTTAGNRGTWLGVMRK